MDHIGTTEEKMETSVLLRVYQLGRIYGVGFTSLGSKGLGFEDYGV